MSAAAKVFGNQPQLVERILIHDLDPAEITRARQLNSYVKAIIDNSLPLQRATFLKPDYSSNENHSLARTSTGRTVHPAIRLRTSDFEDSEASFAINDELFHTNWSPGQWQSHFICQPPGLEFTLHYTQRTEWDGGWKLTQAGLNCRVEGNTLGELMTAIERRKFESDKVQVELSDLRVSMHGFLKEANSESAMKRLLAIPEMAEMVLQGLSTTEVTRARQVSQYFKGVIDNSISLRRRMFLEPEPAGETITYDWSDWFDPDDDADDEEDLAFMRNAREINVMKVHPAIIGLKPTTFNDTETYFKDTTQWFHGEFPINGDLCSTVWAPGMWQKMLVCQPPPSNICLRYLKQAASKDPRGMVVWGPVTKYHHFETVKGNTLGSLLAAMEQLQKGYFGVRVRLIDMEVGMKGLNGEWLSVEDSPLVKTTRASKAAKEKAAEAMRRAAAAADKVFKIPNLFEQILGGLSTAEITRARQVNSSFQAAIDGSLPLRRAMFLESAPSEMLSYEQVKDVTFDAGSDSGSESGSENSEYTEAPAEQFAVLKLHPAIEASVDAHGGIEFQVKEEWEEWEDGLWQAMLISNPPCPGLEVSYFYRSGMQGGMVKGYRKISGNTLGDLMRAVRGVSAYGIKCSNAYLGLKVPKTEKGTQVEVDGSNVVKEARDRALGIEKTDDLSDDTSNPQLNWRPSNRPMARNKWGRPSMG